MSTTYVLVGHPIHNGWSNDPPSAAILAVSADVLKLEAYGKSLRDTTRNTMRPGGASWPPVYVHEGRQFSSVEVVGPVPDLDGPKVVVANTVGTINM